VLTEGANTERTLGVNGGGKVESKWIEATYTAYTHSSLPGQLTGRLWVAQKTSICPILEPHSSICKKNEVKD
jgi:hypothetical protein